MTAPTFYRPSDLSTDPSGIRVGGGDWKYLMDVLDGSHATDRLQQINIEGLNPMFGYKALVRKDGSVYRAYRETGVALSPSSTSNAHEVLQAAIDYVSSVGGGKVFIKDATYTINSVWTIPSTVEVWGESKYGTILKTASSLTATPQVTNADTTNGNSYITLANLTLDHSDVATDTGTDILSFTKVQNSTIYNCYIKNPSTNRAVFWNSGGALEQKDNTFSYNFVESTRSPKPSAAVLDMVQLNDFSDCFVTHNTIKNGGGGTGSASLRSMRAKKTIYAINIVYLSSQSGIYLTDSTDCDIVINTSHDNGLDGIGIVGASVSGGNLILGNRTEVNGRRGIYVEGVNTTVSLNVASENDEEGILLTGARPVAVGNLCRNNGKDTAITPDSKRVGIRLNTVDGGIIADNKCYDDQGTKTQLYGIVETGTGVDNNFIVDNQVLGNAPSGAGLLLAGASTFAKNNHGFNPQGVATISVGASPYAYTNSDRVPEAIYISNGSGTVSAVKRGAGGTTISTTAPCTVWLEPLEVVEVTYSGGTITMVKDRK